MATVPAPFPAGDKFRLLGHMNKDHRDDLSHMLQYYLGLSPTAAAGPELLNVSPRALTVRTADGAMHTIPMDPPMDWADRRARLIDMTLAARAGLAGKPIPPPIARSPAPEAPPEPVPVPVVAAAKAPSPELETQTKQQQQQQVKPQPQAAAATARNDDDNEEVDYHQRPPPAVPVVRQYRGPVGTDWVAAAGVMLYYVVFALVQAYGIERRQPVAAILALTRFPGGPAGFRWFVDVIFVPVVAIHLAEAWWIDRSRLQRHGVSRGSAVWCLWIWGTLSEGFNTFRRFDELVAELKAGKAR